MKTKVFEYKGYVGIQSSLEAEGLLNEPDQPGQLGFVVDANYVEISPKALEVLKKIPKSNDDIGDIDVYQTEDKKVIFCWLGGPLKVICPDEVSGSSSYNANLLKPSKNVKVPQEFMDFIDE